MRIAVCASDVNERYALARMAEDALQPCGVLPNVVLFPMLPELADFFAHMRDTLDLVLVTGARNTPAMRNLCRLAPVILIGDYTFGPDAFAMGAAYYIESPADAEELKKAISRCMTQNVKEYA